MWFFFGSDLFISQPYHTKPYHTKPRHFRPFLGLFDQFLGQKYQKVAGFDLRTHIPWTNWLSCILGWKILVSPFGQFKNHYFGSANIWMFILVSLNIFKSVLCDIVIYELNRIFASIKKIKVSQTCNWRVG